MISISKHSDEIKELRKALAKKYKITTYDYKYPLFYMEDNEIKACGLLLNIRKKRSETFKYGDFTFPQPDGRNICFNNVYEYSIFLKSKDDVFKYIHNPEILEAAEMEDLYFLILKLMNNPKEVTKDYEMIFEMSLYHNDEIILRVENVCGKISKNNNANLIFSTKDKEKKIYNYWVYKDNEMVNLGSGQERDTWKAALDKIGQYDGLKTYKTSGDYIDIYFYADMSEDYLISYEFAKQTADKLEIIENLFDDDDSVNYVARYKKDSLDDIAMAHQILAPKGTCLYGHVIDNIIKGLEGAVIHNQFEEFSLYGEGSNEYYKKLIQDLYKKLKIKEDFSSIPPIVSNYLISAGRQAEFLNDFLNRNHPAYRSENESLNVKKVQVEAAGSSTPMAYEYNRNNSLLREHWKQVKEKRSQLLSQLVAEGRINRKWKNEIMMFRLIKQKFDDAVYQYNIKWLGRQTLDVYIPSLHIGFEYQGIQHYQPVEFFGGMEHHLRQKELDEKKKKLCEKNDVRLIEWKYDEPVNAVQLRIKLEAFL